MNLGTFLQTIITIVFIYLILALIASELQENIAAYFELRARRLRASIKKMLEDTNDELTNELYNHSSIKALNQVAYSWWSMLKEGRSSVGPSYISDSALLAATIISILKEDISPGSTQIEFTKYKDNKILKSLANDSGNDWVKFEKNLQQLYDEVQERSTGVYKRNAKGLSLVIGFLVAIIANADVFNIVTNLSKANQSYSDNLIKKIEEKSSQLFPAGATAGKELTPEQKESISKIVDEAGILPLGWDYDLALEQTNKEKLIAALNKNKEKIELLGKNEGECKDKAELCYQLFFDEIKDRQELVPYLSDELKQAYSNPDSKVFSKAYLTRLEELKKQKKEWESNILSAKAGNNDLGSTIVSNFNKNANKVNKQGGLLRVFFGWLISAIAISMGAPFWFDLLGNIMNVRNSGKDLRRNRK